VLVKFGLANCNLEPKLKLMKQKVALMDHCLAWLAWPVKYLL